MTCTNRYAPLLLLPALLVSGCGESPLLRGTTERYTVTVTAPSAIVAGPQVPLQAIVHDASGMAVTGAVVSWSLDAPSVARLQPSTNGVESIVGIDDGTVTITATWGGDAAIAKVIVLNTPPLTDAVGAESFSVVATGRPGDDNYGWSPVLKVRELTTRGVAEVIGVRVSIDGGGTLATCSGSRPVSAGSTTDLFHFVYGEYELSMGVPGRGVGIASARATVFVKDATGKFGRFSVVGPVVPEDSVQPAEWTAPLATWSCA